MNKNTEVNIAITDIGEDGVGIGKVTEGPDQGYTLFIKDTVPGDDVRALVVKAKKHYGFGRMLEIRKPSESRVQAPCPISRPCGGCQLQQISYDMQLKLKEQKVRNDLERIGGIAHVDGVMLPAVGSTQQFRYRNKAQYPIRAGKDGEPIAGFYAGRTHSVIPCTDCLLGPEEYADILERILRWMRDNHVAPYDENSGNGLLRHVLIRKGFATDEIMVCLIINGRKIPAAQDLVEKLSSISGMVGITVSSNTDRTNVIMTNSAEVVWGRGTITDILRSEKYGVEVAYHISPQSFYQVNHDQTEKIYEKVLDLAGLHGTETVMDLYCGIGTISLFLAGNAAKVIGVEIVSQAIEDAKANAIYNQIKNVEFYVGKAEEVVPVLYGQGAHADVVVVDPPRKGCDEKLLDTIIHMRPKKLIYVSCDPATLARDIKILAEHGCRLISAQPFDQFAQTIHVETVCLLTRKA